MASLQLRAVYIRITTEYSGYDYESNQNTTRSCKYSQVLLMIGENIARNM